VKVKDHVAHLSGKVQSWHEKMNAERVAKAVRGVTDVSNDITIEHAALRNDQDIERDVESRLAWDTLMGNGLIDVSVKDGNVKLSGTVGSLTEKRRAMATAWVGGTNAVDGSALDVKWWAKQADLRQSKYVFKQDDQIRQALKDVILVDPRVNSFDVDVDVTAGVARLRGEMGSLKARRIAEQLARSTLGVLDVKNDLVVKPKFLPSDLVLKDKIETMLRLNPITESFEVGVGVRAGVATLNGKVDSFAEKAEAEAIASGIPGVSKVNNELAVNHSVAFVSRPYFYPYHPFHSMEEVYVPPLALKSDPEILDDVRDELFWSPLVDKGDVTVAVENGTVSLSGTVDSWRQKQVAMENAFEGGAVRVENKLTIRPLR